MDMSAQNTEFVAPQRPPLSINEIVETTARYYGLTKADLKVKTRRRSIVRPRQVAMYLAKQFLVLPKIRSYPEVGRYFDGMDHSTVIHGATLIEELLVRDEAIRQAVTGLTAHITGVAQKAIEQQAKGGDESVPPVEYIASRRNEVSELPNATKPEKPVLSEPQPEFAILRREVPLARISELVSEFYQVPITDVDSDAISDEEGYCRDVVGYLAIRVGRIPSIRLTLSDGSEYRPPYSTSVFVHIESEMRSDASIRADIKTLWDNLMSSNSAPRLR